MQIRGKKISLPRNRFGSEHFTYNLYTGMDPFFHLLGSNINLIDGF